MGGALTVLMKDAILPTLMQVWSGGGGGYEGVRCLRDLEALYPIPWHTHQYHT